MRLSLPVLLLCLVSAASARELYPGQYAQAVPDTRQWFRNQISPKTGGSCCSESDGVYAEEDIRSGHYWTRFVARYFAESGRIVEVETEWMQVPEDVVLHTPNRNGSPVAWWFFVDGKFGVRCYAPGPKL